MYPILFSVGNVSIYSFGLFLSVAILACGILLSVMARRIHLDTHNFFDRYLFIIFIGIICARLTYFFLYPDIFRPPAGSYWSIFALWQGGLVFYGAVVGGISALIFLYRKDRHELMKWLDISMLSFVFGNALGQFGCTLGGCSIGAETSIKLSINHRIPASLYEAIFSLILFFIAIYFYFKKSVELKYRHGSTAMLAGAIFITGRLLIDYFKTAEIEWLGASLYLWFDISVLATVLLALLVKVIFVLRQKSMNHEA